MIDYHRGRVVLADWLIPPQDRIDDLSGRALVGLAHVPFDIETDD